MDCFEMYTDAGNAAVAAIVMQAENMNWSWNQTQEALYKLAEIPGFGEAGDTAVRELVFVTLGYDKAVV